MKRLFEIAIGSEDGVYFAIVSSLTDNKHATVSDVSLKRLLPKMNKLIRVKARQERFIPMPKRSAVVARMNNGHGGIALVTDRN